MRTMGELWDAISEAVAGNFDAEIWLEQWLTLGDDTTFAQWRDFEATELQVRYLLEDLHGYFVERMESICTEAVYSSTLERGRDAMNKIADIADRFGKGFGDAARRPATPTEALIASGCVRRASRPQT